MYPLFSIITVTYNAESTLPRTIQSVKSQTCRLYEHIIMDGQSTDSTLDIARAYHESDQRCLLMSRKDKGIYDAMNRALSMANGDYLIFLNAGDTFHSPETLQHLADCIMQYDYPGIVYGQTEIVDIDGNYLGPRHLKAPEKLTLKSFSDGMVVCHQAFVAHRSVAGLYNLNYKYSSDYEWCIICLQRSRRNQYMPEVLIDYLNEGVTTRNHRKSLIERFKIMSTYYGFVPSALKHVKFLFRDMRRKVAKPCKQAR